MALLGLVVLFIVVRPLVRRIVTVEGAAAGIAGAAGTAGVAGAIGSGVTTVVATATAASPTARRQHLDRRRRRIGRHLQSHLGDDRCRQGAGTGSRPIGAEGRRVGRKEPARSRFHHPQLAHEDAA